MKAYVITTGMVFGLVVVAHLARIFADGDRAMISNPVFIAITLLAAALCAWAVLVLKRLT